MSAEVFRKGLDLKHVDAGELPRDYHSDLIETIRNNDFTYQDGRVSIHLAEEFGFCYGVDRAVDYAYQTRKKFPERTVYLTGEIIHNPGSLKEWARGFSKEVVERCEFDFRDDFFTRSILPPDFT